MIVTLIKKYKIYGPKRFVEFSFKEIYRKIYSEKMNHSYSQKGEDLVIDKLLGNKKRGFYIDVGAYAPDRFSNTKHFYEKGWRGINIEPDYEQYTAFVLKRKRDINLNIGIGQEKKKLSFFRFFPATLSTFSESEAKKYKKMGYKFLGTRNVKVIPLKDVFRLYTKGKSVDFLSVDTEGFDMEVLKSNNWEKFKPKLICIESSSHSLSKTSKQYNYATFLSQFGYKKVYDNNLNSLFLHQK
jgi:FkbM family methyltransferase